jgi:hypothetical protein
MANTAIPGIPAIGFVLQKSENNPPILNWVRFVVSRKTFPTDWLQTTYTKMALFFRMAKR